MAPTSDSANTGEDGTERKVRKGVARTRLNDGIWGHAVVSIGVSVAGALVAFAILWWQVVVQPNAAQADHQAQLRAQSLAAYFNSRLQTLQIEVSALAAAPSTVAALTAYDATTADTEGAKLAAALPFAHRVDLVPKGDAEVDLNAEIPITFAALDVIRRAETREFVGPEVSLNQRDMIYLAKPIADDGVVAGVLFVGLSSNYFLRGLDNFDDNSGQLTIRQRFTGSTASDVFQWGNHGDSDEPAKTVQLDAPHWQLSWRPSSNSVFQASGITDLMAPLAVVVGLILGGVWLGFKRHIRLLGEDTEQLTEFVSRLLRGRPAKVERYNVPMLREVAASLSRYDEGIDRSVAADVPARKSKAANSDVDDLLADEKPAAKSRDDDDFLDVDDEPDENFGMEVTEAEGPLSSGVEISTELFHPQEIVGDAKELLTPAVAYWLGRAFAAEALESKIKRVAIGHDCRAANSELSPELARGLNEGGCDVLDIGETATPLLYFATVELNTKAGVMLTGGHHPADTVGMRMIIDGKTVTGKTLRGLKKRLDESLLTLGEGSTEDVEIVDAYVDRVLDDAAIAQSVKVVVDAGNGVVGTILPRLLEELSCEVVPLYCDPAGDFPNRAPDPGEDDQLEDLVTVIEAEQAQLGIAFDGGGSRMTVVTNSGAILSSDQLVMLFARDIVSRNPGTDVVSDIKCSRHVNAIISDNGGRPVMSASGHAAISAKLHESGALLGGGYGGTICFGERWSGVDDALYAAVRLLEIVGAESISLDEIIADLPQTNATPDILVATMGDPTHLVEKLETTGEFGDGTLTALGGVRVDYQDGWGLVQVADSIHGLSLRFEADDATALERIQDEFRAQLTNLEPKLAFNRSTSAA